MSATPAVTLVPFVWQRDAVKLADWLDRPHVATWWGPRDEVIQELAAHIETDMALIAMDGDPVGLICWQIPTREELAEAGLDDLPRDLVDIDLMIGEAEALGRGIGPAALRRLFERLRAKGVPRVGLATSQTNLRALRAFEKAGFTPWRDFVEKGESYRYLTRDL
jgi:aminoglycoside 6'-N-acetyltransferase